jgi:signal transduction histidine kinase
MSPYPRATRGSLPSRFWRKLRPVPPFREFARLGPMGRVWVLNGTLAIAAAGLFLGGVLGRPAIAAPFEVPWWALAVLFYLAEVFVVHIQFQRDAHSVSLGEIPLLLGLFFAAPAALVIGQIVGDGLALAIHRRQSPVKFTFNLSHFTVETCLASILFRTVLAGGNPIGPAGWSAAFSAVVASSAFGVLMVFAVISLSEGRMRMRMLPGMLGTGIGVTLANAGIALAAITVAWSQPQAAWVLLVPTGILYLGYRGYTRMVRRHEGLNFLYEAVRTFHRAPNPGEAAIVQLLAHTREAFKAEEAEIVFLPSREEERPTRTALGPGEHRAVMVPFDLHEGLPQVTEAIEEMRSILVRRSPDGEDDEIREAMVTPIPGQLGVIGAILVANRLGAVGSFEERDLELLETLAEHLGVSLDNARLGLLEEEVTQLAETNRVKDDLIASTSHELRTPLTSIQGFVKTLLRSDVEFSPEEQRSFLETVERQSERLSRLVEDLLMASRLENGPAMAVRAPEAPETLLRRVAEEVAPQAGKREMSVEAPEELPSVLTDGERVHQILLNLVVNAIKYSPDGSTITLGAASGEKGLVLSVQDQGFGIPPELHGKIFDRLYQVDQTATRAAGGVGLGLYISQRLAETLGGRLWLERSDGDGSAFCLSIPWDQPKRSRDPNAIGSDAAV